MTISEQTERSRINDNDYNTNLLLPSEVNIKVAPKLLRLQFPQADEGIHIWLWLIYSYRYILYLEEQCTPVTWPM